MFIQIDLPLFTINFYMITSGNFSISAMNVNVIFDERNLKFQVIRISTTMFEFKQLIFDKYGIPVHEQILYEYKSHFDTLPLHDGYAFGHLHAQKDEIVLLLVLRNIRPRITIEVKVPFEERQFLFLDCHRLDTIEMLIENIYAVIRPEDYLFELDDNGKVLLDDMNMFKCNFQDGSTVNCSRKPVCRRRRV